MKHHSICFMPRHPWSILIWSKSHKPSVAVSPVMQWAAVAGHGRTDSYSFCLQRILAKTKQRRVPIARCSNDWPTHGNTGAWIHSPGSRSYSTQPALPFSNCTIKEFQYGWNPVKEKTDTTNSDTVPGGNVRLFFLTLNDHATVDQPILNVDKNFRLDAEQSKFKHFLKNSPKLSWKASPDSRPRSLHCSSSYTLSRG